MIYRIVCPVQPAEKFDIGSCAGCKYYEVTIGKSTTYRCRKNRSPLHKRDFEGAVLSARLGLPDAVMVEGTEEPKKG